jgi:TRAP-type C4-dicarboxylate transport system substrate-binding protein
MKRRTTLALAAALAAVLGAGAALAQDVTLRVHHFLSPRGAVPANFIEPWAQKVMDESGGRIKVEIYPAMQLGGAPPTLYDQVKDGVVDIVWTLTSYTPGRFPETEALELPFMTPTSGEAASRAAWTFVQENAMERFGDVHLIAVHMHGPGVIHKKGPPITSMDDFRGLKLRGPSRLSSKLLESLGATPVSMPVPAFPEALSKGVVDGGVIPFEVVPALKVEELVDSHTRIGGDTAMYNVTFIFAMNKARYESLPADLRAVIDANSGIEASAWAGRAMDAGDAAGIKVIEARGNVIATTDEALTAQLRAASEGVAAAWVAEVTAAGLDGAMLLEKARAVMAAARAAQ